MSAYDWSRIKRVYRFGYLLLAVNIGLAYGSYQSDKAVNTRMSKTDHLPKGTIYARRGVKLRYDPNTSSDAKVSIPNGALISVLNDTSTANPGWVQVSYMGNDSWVWGQYIRR